MDPEKPLAVTTSTVASASSIRRALAWQGVGVTGVQTLILEFVGGVVNPDSVHRKVLRDQARTAMSKNRSQWTT